MTLFEYLSNILAAFKGIAKTEQSEDSKLTSVASDIKSIKEFEGLESAHLESLSSATSSIARGVLVLAEDNEGIKTEQAAQRVLLQKILNAVTPLPAVQIRFNVTLEGQTIEGATHVKIKDTEQFPVSLTFLDAKIQPAQVQAGTVVFAGFPSVTITQDPTDETKALVVGQLPGTGQISASADADLGDGVTTITGTLDVEVVGGDATIVQLNAGPAVTQP